MPVIAIKSGWTVLRSPVTLWVVLGAAIIFAGWRGYSAIFDRGISICEARNSKALAESIIRAEVQARELALQDAEVLQEGTTERERIRNVYRDREIEIVKHVPDCSACRVSAAGIGVLNDALSNAPAPPANPGGESGALPGPSVPDSGGDYSRGLRDLDSRGRQVL